MGKFIMDGVPYGEGTQIYNNTYGAFIDTTNVLKPRTTYSGSFSYTATQDCAVVIDVANTRNSSASIFIDNTAVGGIYGENSINQLTDTYYIKRGQTISGTTNVSGAAVGYAVYGLTFGTNNIFTPQIYSLEEREVGVWIDGKPLYQKTYDLSSEITVSNTDWTSTGIIASNLGIETYIRCLAQNSSGTCWDAINVATIDSNISLTAWRNGDTIGVKKFTIQYTKTTDTPGSGQYNNLGVPMKHYSTDEQIVGIDESNNTIYEKTLIQLSSPTWSVVNNISYFDVDTSSINGVQTAWIYRGLVHENNDNRDLMLPYGRLASNEEINYECRVNSDNTIKLGIYNRSANHSGYNLSNLRITIQYTKTTT